MFINKKTILSFETSSDSKACHSSSTISRLKWIIMNDGNTRNYLKKKIKIERKFVALIKITWRSKFKFTIEIFY